MNPMVLLDFLNSVRATSLGTKSVSLIARNTFYLFSSVTFAVPFITRDTVAGDTPASLATSRMLAISHLAMK